jgi:hypothetical protein
MQGKAKDRSISQVNTCSANSRCLPEKTGRDATEFSAAETLEKLNVLVKLSCQSAKLPPLQVATKDGCYRNERSQISVFIQTPFGEFKSTILKFASQHYPSIILTDVTFPKLVGSYDVESKRIVPSACWEYRKKTILLDEFHFRSGIINALLGLMEGGEYARAIARNVARSTSKKDGDLYFKCSKTGWIRVKTRFSAVIGTMHNVVYIPHLTYDALVSRCIPVYYRLFPSDFREILEGERKLFTPLDFGVEPLTQVDWDDVEYVWDVVENSCLGQYSHLHNLIARTTGDLLRCFSILGRHDDELYSFIIAMKSHLPHVRWLSGITHGKKRKKGNVVKF